MNLSSGASSMVNDPNGDPNLPPYSYDPKKAGELLDAAGYPAGRGGVRFETGEIAELAQRRDLLVVSDEIYEYYLFDGNQQVSIASLPGMRERTITINSFSKSFGMTGMRLRYIAAPVPLVEAMLPFHHAMMIRANTITQYAGAALNAPRDWFGDMLKEYGRRRTVLMQMLNSIGMPYSDPQGSYYIFVDIRPTGLSSAAFVKRAREEVRLTFQPGSDADESFIRGAYTKASSDFDEGLDRFAAL